MKKKPISDDVKNLIRFIFKSMAETNKNKKMFCPQLESGNHSILIADNFFNCQRKQMSIYHIVYKGKCTFS